LRKAIWLFSIHCHPALDAGSRYLEADFPHTNIIGEGVKKQPDERKYPVRFPQKIEMLHKS